MTNYSTALLVWFSLEMLSSFTADLFCGYTNVMSVCAGSRFSVSPQSWCAELMGRCTQLWPARLTATKSQRPCCPDPLSRSRPYCPERRPLSHLVDLNNTRWAPAKDGLFKELCNLYSVITQMYIKAVVKVGFSVGTVGCGSLTSETDAPVCQQERTLNVYDPFTLAAAGSQLVFLSVKNLLLSVCFHTMYSGYLIMFYNCTKLSFYWKYWTLYKKNTLTLRDLSYFSTLKSGQ